MTIKTMTTYKQFILFLLMLLQIPGTHTLAAPLPAAPSSTPESIDFGETNYDFIEVAPEIMGTAESATPSFTPAPSPLPTLTLLPSPEPLPPIVPTITVNNTTVVNPPSTLYLFKDLDYLLQEKNYSEFFKHANDIRPAERDLQWKSMVNTMAESFVYDQKKKKLVTFATLKELDQLLEWPLLKENLFFIRGRSQIGLSYFENCFQANASKALCLSQMIAFWQEHPYDPDVALKMGKLAHLYGTPENKEALLFFDPLLRSEIADKACRDPLVRK
ncbi:MAG: hypothetical protein HQK50_18245 [Oligoflexia bacterium]|nr:hypothetical protein [Oligoflexia bacterium]